MSNEKFALLLDRATSGGGWVELISREQCRKIDSRSVSILRYENMLGRKSRGRLPIGIAVEGDSFRKIIIRYFNIPFEEDEVDQMTMNNEIEI